MRHQTAIDLGIVAMVDSMATVNIIGKANEKPEGKEFVWESRGKVRAGEEGASREAFSDLSEV